MMRGPAGFHDDQIDLPIDEPALELRTGEATRFHDLPSLSGHRELENALRHIDADDGGTDHGHGSSIHVGLPFLRADTPHHMRPAGTMMPKD